MLTFLNGAEQREAERCRALLQRCTVSTAVTTAAYSAVTTCHHTCSAITTVAVLSPLLQCGAVTTAAVQWSPLACNASAVADVTEAYNLRPDTAAAPPASELMLAPPLLLLLLLLFTVTPNIIPSAAVV